MDKGIRTDQVKQNPNNKSINRIKAHETPTKSPLLAFELNNFYLRAPLIKSYRAEDESESEKHWNEMKDFSLKRNQSIWRETGRWKR